MRKICLIGSALLMLQIAVAQRTLLIKNVNVVDVEKGALLKNAFVLIQDSIIIEIATRSKKADTVIDAGNRYLIPGLWDMHTHVWTDGQFFPLLLTNGVTGIRDMFDNMIAVNNWRKSIAEGRSNGPVIVAAGPIIDGEKPVWPGSVAVKDPAQAKAVVDSVKNKVHADFLKVYSLLSREVYFALAEEARKQQFVFAGHVPNMITVLEAAKAGQKSLEHLYGFIEAASDSADHYMQVLQKKIVDTNLKTLAQRKQFLFRTYNPGKLKTVLQEMKKYDTWICPTMTVNYSMSHMNDSNLHKDQRLYYIPKFISSGWTPKDFRLKSLDNESYRILQAEFHMKLKVIKAVHDAGIPLLAGTDFPNPYCFPGFSLHDELQWMVKAGLTPAQALQTATVNPARYLKMQGYGVVAANKIADLVLLDGNPLENIDNTKKIWGVILHGKVLDKKYIDGTLQKAKDSSGH